MGDIDWRAVLAHVTPPNVAKWILVIGFGVAVVIALSYFAALAWGAS